MQCYLQMPVMTAVVHACSLLYAYSSHAFCRALGDFTFKYPVQALVAQPEVHSHQLDPERDMLVMSVTDGVTDFISDHELGKLAWRSLQEVRGAAGRRGGGGQLCMGQLVVAVHSIGKPNALGGGFVGIVEVLTLWCRAQAAKTLL